MNTTVKEDCSFAWFIERVKSMGGIWNTEHVYFSQFVDGWDAAYQPEHPNHSKEDQAISYRWLTDQWKYTSPEELHKQYQELHMD